MGGIQVSYLCICRAEVDVDTFIYWCSREKCSHLKQGTIGQLSEAFDGFLDKLIIFEPIM